ncbi:MAG: hypothetical protein N2747_04220 [Chitinophagaceae bacterium]|nr:hypothetical protein [Chitinophagaceae bacterium]
MKNLMMFIGNHFIEAVQVDENELSKPGYLGKFKRELKEKYKELIKNSDQSPVFVVCDPEFLPRNMFLKNNSSDKN